MPLSPILVGEGLAPLHFCDPQAFIANNEEDKLVCDFVLSLALIYNDLIDSLSILVHLINLKPKLAFEISKIFGEFSGVEQHHYRTLLLEMHELFYLLQQKKKTDLFKLQL